MPDGNPDAGRLAVKQFYDGLAHRYDRLRYGTRYEATVGALELEFVGRFLRDGPCADVGAGTGRVTTYLLGRGHPVTAVDLSAAMLGKLGEKARNDPRLTRRVLDVDHLDSLDGYGGFPNVLALRLLSHVRDPLRALAMLRDALASDGVLIVDLWNACSYRALLTALGLSKLTVYTRYYTIRAMRGMLAAAGLVVRARRGFGLPPLAPLLALERAELVRCDPVAQRIVWVCERAR
jgi:SAM-dependent methyltransferase